MNRLSVCCVALLLVSVLHPQIILLSRDAEINLGREVAKEIEKEYGVLDDPTLTKRIEKIGQRLVEVCDRPNMPYTFKVLKEEKELNAIAAPGGFIYITHALVKALESDDEIAFVLGHEIGHVAGDHIRKRLSQLLVSSTLLDLLTYRSGETVRAASQFVFLLYERGYSRNHERDADTRSLIYMERAGYNPMAALTALKKLGDKRYKGLVKWFATHPSPPERAERLAKQLNVDLQTLEPLPKGGVSRPAAPPKTAFTVFFLSQSQLLRFGPDSPAAEMVWDLKGKIVDALETDRARKVVWLAFRSEGSPVAHIVTLDPATGRRKFVASLYADRVQLLDISPDRSFLLLDSSGKETRLRVFDERGQEVPFRDRTPLGTVQAATWLADGSILIVTERFGEIQWAVGSPGRAFRFFPFLPSSARPARLFPDGRDQWYALVNGAISRVLIGEEAMRAQPILSGVSLASRHGDRWAVVKEGTLFVGTVSDGNWKGQTLDSRKGSYGSLQFSPDGKWLAYLFVPTGSDAQRLYIKHISSGTVLSLPSPVERFVLVNE